jgi:hypothetical protein
VGYKVAVEGVKNIFGGIDRDLRRSCSAPIAMYGIRGTIDSEKQAGINAEDFLKKFNHITDNGTRYWRRNFKRCCWSTSDVGS